MVFLDIEEDSPLWDFWIGAAEWDIIIDFVSLMNRN
jgi:hypothetical protein